MKRIEFALLGCLALAAGACANTQATTPPPPPASYLVFFDFDKAAISPTAQLVIDKAVADAKAQKPVRITISGNTDLSGDPRYNLALAKKRAEAVAAALIRAGVPANQMHVEWFGESRPKVKTADGVREPQNRNVEIKFAK